MKFPRFLKLLFCLFLIWPLLSFSAQAQDVSFEARVDRKSVHLGSFVQMTLTVKGAQDLDPIRLPDIDGFDIRYLGPSTHISIVNGQYSASTSYIYNLYPQRTGDLRIPPFLIIYKGKEYKTDQIGIQVFDQDAAPGAPGGESASVSLSDKIFLRLQVPQQDVLVNERIPLSIRLYIRDLTAKIPSYPEFAHTGFTLDNYQEAGDGYEVINGQKFKYYEFMASLYPTRTGTLILGPARVVCDIVTKRNVRQRRFGTFDSFFGDDFLNSFFDDYDTRSLPLESQPLRINVSPLPTKDQPKDFSGAVGRFDFEMEVSPEKVKVGDPITVRMRVKGQGNLEAIDLPDLSTYLGDEAYFKVYEPTIKIENDVKILEQVVIARSSTVEGLPQINFSYFDPQAMAYRTISRGPFALEVHELSPQEQGRVVGLEASSASLPGSREPLGRDISFIKSHPGAWQPRGSRLYRRVSFWIFFVSGLFLWTGFYLFYRFRHKVKTDERFARRLLAPRYAQKGLRLSREYLRSGKGQEFYDTLFKTLQHYLANKFHLPVGEVSLTVVGPILQEQGADAHMSQKVNQVWQACEMVRYGSIQPQEKQMQALLRQTEEIIDYFERL